MQYTVKEVSEMFDVTPQDISTMIAKGGIKGVTTSPSEWGIEYVLNDRSVDDIGAILGKTPKAEVEEEDVDIRTEVKEGFKDAIIELDSAGILSEIVFKALDTDEFQKRINNAVFSAMNGVRKLSDREKRDIVPQKWR